MRLKGVQAAYIKRNSTATIAAAPVTATPGDCLGFFCGCGCYAISLSEQL